VKIDPEKGEGKSPPEKVGVAFGAFEDQQPKAGEQERKNLRAHAPDGRSGPGGTERGDSGDIGSGTAAQVEQEKCGSEDGGEDQDEAAEAGDALEFVNSKFGEPLVRDPGLAGAGVGKGIGVRDALCCAMYSPALRCHQTSGSVTLRAVMVNRPRNSTARNVFLVVRVAVMKSRGIGGGLRAEEHDCQHGQIEEDNGDAADFGKVCRLMIPAVDSRAPTEENCRKNFAAGFGDEPEGEGVEEPALRHHCGKQEQPRITIAVTKQCEPEKRSGKNDQGNEVFVIVRLAEPK